MEYHSTTPSFENETTDHFFLKADQHSSHYGKLGFKSFIHRDLRERKPVLTNISTGMVKASSRRSVMNVWLSSRLLLFYEENILLDVNVRKWYRIDLCFLNPINIMLIRVRLPPRAGFWKFLSADTCLSNLSRILYIYIYLPGVMKTRVSKHFVISLNFPCVMACLLSYIVCLYIFCSFCG